MFKRFSVLLLVLVLAMGVVAPGAFAADTVPPTVELIDGAETVLVGGTGGYFYVMEGVASGSVTVTSSNPKVLKVGVKEQSHDSEENSYIGSFSCTGVKTGTVKITVKSAEVPSAVDTFTVKVTDKISHLRVESPNTTALKPGGSCVLYAYAFGKNSYIASDIRAKSGVKWTSGNKKVATVNKKTGKVTVKKNAKPGSTVKITAAYKGKKAKWIIHVVKKAKVTKIVTYEDIIIPPGASAQADCTVYTKPANKKNGHVGKATFKSSNPSIASVDNTGRILAKKTGVAKVTIKMGGKQTYVYVGVAGAGQF